MSLTKVNNATPANRHSRPNQTLIQQTAIQRAQNEKAGQSEHESDIQTAVQLKSSHEPRADFIRPNALVQAKLNIGKPNDKYEVEADRVADKIVSGQGTPENKSTTAPKSIQKKDASGPVEGEGAKEEDVTETDIQQKTQKSSATGEDDTTVQEKTLSENITPVVQLKELPPIQQKGDGEEKIATTEAEQNKIQTKCSSCGKEASSEKLSIQQKCSKCEAKENEVQAKLDASTEDVQQMKTPQEDQPTSEAPGQSKVQTKCSSCGKEESSEKLNVQQKCSKCEAKENEVQAKLDASTENVQQTKVPDTESQQSELQQKSNGEGSNTGVESSLKASKGKGSAMDDSTRSSMESGFGSDFSNVRIHTDSNAVQMNQSLGSKAFTNGSDIYFNEGEYSPSSKSGQHLLAHELTHTVQQGAAPKGVQKKKTNDEDTSLQKKGAENTGSLNIQKADDDCKPPKKEQGEKQKYNNITKESTCSTCYTTPIKPSEGQKEPDREEKKKNVEAKAKTTPGERQKQAPPVNDDSKHEGKKPPQPVKDPTKICEEREAKKAKKESAKSGGDTDLSGKKDDPKKKEGKKKDEKKKGDSLQDIADEKKEGKEKKLSPKGEMASAGAVTERAAAIMKVATETGGVMKARNGIKSIGNTPVSFLNSSNQKGSAANQKVNAFLRSKSESAAGILDDGMKSVTGIKKHTATQRKKMEADIRRKRDSSKAYFFVKKLQTRLKTGEAILSLEAQHLITTSTINLKAITDTAALRAKYKKDVDKINLDHSNYVIALNEKFKKGYTDHIDAGNDFGQQAYDEGKKQSKLYKEAKNAGACSYDQEKVKNKEKDGDWDGLLTVNRYEARSKSALETGKQYKESMQESAKEAAKKLLCDKKNQLKMAQGFKKIALENLKCALDDGLDAIELRKTGALKEANIVKEQYSKNFTASMKATIAELDKKEMIQDILISDFGARQIVALENIALQATIGLVTALNQQAAALHKQLRDYANSISKRKVPNAKALDNELIFSETEFNSGQQAIKVSIESAVSKAKSLIDKNAGAGKKSINSVYRKGISEGNLFYTKFEKLTNDLNASRAQYYSKLLKQSIDALSAEYKNAIQTTDSVLKLHTETLKKYGEQVDTMIKGRLDGLKKGMTKTVTKDLGPSICNEAEKAAKEIQPWWKKWAKVLLYIIVIAVVIVLSVVTAGAFAAIGGAIFGAGTVMAGTAALAMSGAVMGALSSFLITVGTNVINNHGNGELTWDVALKGAWDAVKVGFISGFIGGFAGPFIHVIRAGVGPMSTLGAVALREGIELAFDLVGAIAGDLIVHGKIKSWSGIFLSAFVARSINIGTKKLGPKIDSKIPNKLKIKPDAAKGQFKFEGFDVKGAKPEVGSVKADGDAQTNTPKNEGVDTNTNTSKTTETGDTNTNTSKTNKTGDTKTKTEGDTDTNTGDTKTKTEGDTDTNTGDTKTKTEGDTDTNTGDTKTKTEGDTDTNTGDTKTKTEGDTDTNTGDTKTKTEGDTDTNTGDTKTKTEGDTDTNTGDTKTKTEGDTDANTGDTKTKTEGDTDTNTGDTKTKTEGDTDTNTGDTKTKTEGDTDANTGDTKTKTEGDTDANTNTNKNTETSNTNTKTEGEVEWSTQPKTAGEKQAYKLGYDEAPPGHQWVKGKNGPYIRRTSGYDGTPMKFDPKTKSFVPAGAKPTSWKNPPRTAGEKLAHKLGYDEAPPGHQWVKGKNGPYIRRTSGYDGTPMKFDPKTKTFKPADGGKSAANTKKVGDETALEKTRTRDTLSDEEFDVEFGAVRTRQPGKKIDLEHDGIKYTEEVELPNGHKWRKRKDGGWCRFSKRTCYPKGKTGRKKSGVHFRGLSQNRPLRELTHADLVKAFKPTGYTLSSHAITRLKNPRTEAIGFNTLNDIKQIFNKGNRFDAGRGDIGYSYRGMEVIINPNTNNIITFRPARNNRG